MNFPKMLLVSGKASTGFTGFNIAPPLGLYQLKHYISQHGFHCELFDREINTADSYLSRAEAGEFDVFGFSVTRNNIEDDLNIMNKFLQASKNSGKKAMLIAGGQEATLSYKQWLECGVDLIFIGFAEKALLQFCRNLEALGPTEFKRALGVSSLVDDIDGVAYKDDCDNMVYAPAKPFDQTEFRELFHDNIMSIDIPYHDYWKRMRREVAAVSAGAADFIIENVRIYTTSHCPRGCGFCNQQAFLPESFKRKIPITMLSAEDIIDIVITFHQRYGCTSVLFSDDDFPVGTRAGLGRLISFCNDVIERKKVGQLPPNFRFSCQARIIDFINKENGRQPNIELMKLMLRAGFMSLGLGVETFSDRIIKSPSINKIGVTVEDCRKVIQAMLDVGLVPQMNLIIGIPEYTPSELINTIETAVNFLYNGCDLALTDVLMAVPQAPIASKGLYEIQTRVINNPINGRDVILNNYYKPFNPTIAYVSMNLRDVSAASLEKIKNKYGWSGKLVHKRIIGLNSLFCVAQMVGNDELANQIEVLMQSIIAREQGR